MKEPCKTLKTSKKITEIISKIVLLVMAILKINKNPGQKLFIMNFTKNVGIHFTVWHFKNKIIKRIKVVRFKMLVAFLD